MSESSSGWSSPGGSPPDPPAQPAEPGPGGPPPAYGSGYGAPGYGPPGGSTPGGTPGGTPGYGPPPGWQAPPGWGPPGAPAWGAPRPPEARPGVVPLRPLGLGELLDGAVQVVRRYPRPTLGLSALVALVSTLLNVLVVVTAFRPLASLDTTRTTGSTGSTGSVGVSTELDAELGGVVTGSLATGLVVGLATVVLAGVITAVVGRAVLGQPIGFGEAWAQVRPRLLALVGLALLVGAVLFVPLAAAIGAAIALFAVSGSAGAVLGVLLVLAAVAWAVYAYVRLSLAPAALVLERCGVRESMRRSGVLVRRSWWRVLGVLAVTWLIVQVVGGVLQLPFAVVGLGGGLLSGEADVASTAYLVASAVGSGLTLALVAPFETGVRSLLYVDRRMRAEGLDVALQASAASPPA